MDYQTFEKVNKFINVEAYIFFLTQELKQQYKLSLKELLILAYFYYKNEHSISLKEIIGDILYKQSDVVKNIKSLSKKGFINKSRLDLSILYVISSRKNEILNLKDLFESIRFMYPQIVRSVNRLNNKGMLIKERSLADERIVLIKINKIQYNTIKSIFTDTSKILKPRKFFF
ncbi:TPA: transcriptional regulator, SarA/Rot family [Staphylococcus aureus]